jgi:hypothetical protein
MSKDEGFQPPTQGPIFGDGDPEQSGQYIAEDSVGTPPEGSVDEVKAWVGDDKARAAAALKAEQVGDKRTSLIQALERLVD